MDLLDVVKFTRSIHGHAAGTTGTVVTIASDLTAGTRVAVVEIDERGTLVDAPVDALEVTWSHADHMAPPPPSR